MKLDEIYDHPTIFVPLLKLEFSDLTRPPYAPNEWVLKDIQGKLRNFNVPLSAAINLEDGQ